MAWFRPTSHIANGWSSPESAYDGNAGTSASYGISGNSWSNYLEMYFSEAVECSEIRIYTSRQNSSVTTVEFDIRQNNTWTNVYSGAPTDGGAAVTTVIDPVQTVDAIRVRFYADHGGGTRTAYIHDTELFEVEEATYDFTGGSGTTVNVAGNGAGTKNSLSGIGVNVAVTSAGTGEGPSQPADAIKLTIQSSKIDATLTDFPVYVDLSAMPQAFWDNLGTDTIAVYADDETTKLDRELVWIDTVAKTGELWFRAPSISSTTDTVFFVKFVESETNSTSVWNSDYQAVYHLQEASSTEANHYKDSTSNERHGTGGPDATYFPEPPTQIDGTIGKGSRTNGVDEGMATANTELSETAYAASSIRAWVRRQADSQSSRSAIFGKRRTDGNAYELGIRMDASNHLQIETNSGSAFRAVTSSNVLNNDTWVLVHGRFDAPGTIQIFENGVYVGESPSYSEGITVSNTPIGAGGIMAFTSNDNNRRFNGDVDEARLALTSWTDAWIKAEYENEANFATFITIEAETSEETYSGGSGSVVNISAAATGTKTTAGESGTVLNIAANGTGSKQSTGASFAGIEITTGSTGAKQTSGAAHSQITISAEGAGSSEEIYDFNGGAGIALLVTTAAQGNKTAKNSAGADLHINAASQGIKSAMGGAGVSTYTRGAGTGIKAVGGNSGASVSVSSEGSGQIDPTGASGGSGVVVQVVYDGAGMKSGRSPPAGATVEITAAGTGQKAEIQTAAGGSGAVVIIAAAGTGSSAELEAKSGGAGTDLHINADGAGYKAALGGGNTTVLVTAASPKVIRKIYVVEVDVIKVNILTTQKRAGITTAEIKRVVT